MSLTFDDIVRLLDQRGSQQYGLEAVSQREHALQCAHLAETAGEPDALVIACLLHDLGHMIAAEKAGTMETDMSQDDLHQYTLLPFLRGVLPDAVLEPIRPARRRQALPLSGRGRLLRIAVDRLGAQLDPAGRRLHRRRIARLSVPAVRPGGRPPAPL